MRPARSRTTSRLARTASLALLVLLIAGGHASVLASTGGPDAGGYTWIDSDESTGPAFDFEQAPSWVSPLLAGCDDCVAHLPGFAWGFDFYDGTYFEAWVSSNGFLTFEATADSAPAPHALPAPLEPNALIAGFWTDLDLSAGGAVYAWYNDQGDLIVSWVDVPLAGSTETATFQIKLIPLRGIEVHYLSIPESPLAIAGIESPLGAAGLTYKLGFPSVADLAVRYLCAPCDELVSPAGSISITDAGAGPVLQTTLSPAVWSCVTSGGAQTPTMRCTSLTPPAAPPGAAWSCHQANLAALTAGVSARVIGIMDCDGAAPAGLVTRILTGFDADAEQGVLGLADAIVCSAVGPSGNAPTPPYSVTCVV